jgi:LEA14-like dessication related protein
MFVSIMESDTKKIVGTLAVMAAIGGGFYLIKKGKRLLSGAKMNFALLGFRIHKLTLQEVQFAVKLRCYNPTKSPITLAVNQVVAKYKGSAIAFSTPDIKGLTIAAGSSQEIEIKFQVPYLNLMGKGITMALLAHKV